MKLGLKSALLRLLTAVGLPQAMLPKLIKETRFALRQDWERESRNLAKRLDTSLVKYAKQADKRAKQGDKTLAAGLRDIKEQIRSFDDRLGDLERRAEADHLRQARLEALLVQDEGPEPGNLAQFDLERIAQHVKRRLEVASISEQPFAHMIVDDLLPADFYELLVEAIPPRGLLRAGKEEQARFPTEYEAGTATDEGDLGLHGPAGLSASLDADPAGAICAAAG